MQTSTSSQNPVDPPVVVTERVPIGGTLGVEANEAYLLAIMFRGVQRFISESVSTRDLAISSSAASYLMTLVCEQLVSDGAKLVSPLLVEVTDGAAPSIPNRVIALVSNPKEAAKSAIARAENKWNTWLEGVANAESGSTPEFTWVACVVSDGEKKSMDTLMSAVDARKRLSMFEIADISWSSAQNPAFEICPVTGRFPVVDTPSKFAWMGKDRASASVWAKRNASFSGDDAQGNFTYERFPSTATIAVSPWVEDVSAATDSGEIDQSKVSDFVEACKHLDKAFGGSSMRTDSIARAGTANTSPLSKIEGRWFLMEQFSHANVQDQLRVREREETAERAAARERALLARGALLKAAAQVGLGAPTRYLALVALDGDSLGIRLGDLETFDQHREVSKALAVVASSHRLLEGSRACRVVYSGGDDLFALSSGRDAIALVADARAALMKDCEQILPGVTASAGIVWMHYAGSLQLAVQEAQHLVTRTKQVDALKDRVGLLVRRRGGIRAECNFHLGGDGPAAFQRIVEAFELKRLSPSVIGDLERSFDREQLSTRNRNALVSHLMTRHLEGIESSSRLLAAKSLVADLVTLTNDRFGSTSQNPNDLTQTLGVVSVLVTARFLAAEAPKRHATKASSVA